MRRPLLWFLLYLSLFAGLFFLAPRLSLLRTFQLLWQDALFLLRGEEVSSRSPVVVVAIDEPSFREIGLRWPWPRSLHARLVSALKKAGARAVAFDVLFVEPSNDPAEDQLFARTLNETGNVVMGMALSTVERQGFLETLPVWPLESLAQAAASLGVVNFFPDEDGVIRHAYQEVGDLPSLAAAALMVAGETKALERCPNEFLIDFKGPAGGAPVVSYYQALSPEKYLPPGFFKDRIVLVGLASEAAVEVNRGAVDAFPTPYFRLDRKLVFGVKIHAESALTLLEGCPLKAWPSAGPQNLFLFAALSLVSLYLRRAPWRLSAWMLFVTGGLFLASAMLFIKGQRIYTPLPGLCAFLLSSVGAGIYSFASTAREKAFLRKAFSLYVPAELVEEVVKRPELLRLGGERREITILFSDIRGFTTLSENLDPEVLSQLLNTYFNRMTAEIFAEKGTLDKFIGDAIMALFGAPIPFEDHAERACRAALRMTRALAEIASSWKEAGIPSLKIGIGINTGVAVVGNLGSEKRFDYTAIGDAVNLASRLEGLCKLYQVSIICSEYTFYKAKDAFPWRELDYVRVKGKKKPIKIYELRKEEDILVDKLYGEGLKFYREGRFEEALGYFEKVLTLKPEDGPSLLMRKRCLSLMENPPQEWTGVWEIKTK